MFIVSRRDRIARDAFLSVVIEREVAKKGCRIISASGEGTENDDATSIFFERLAPSNLDAKLRALETELGEVESAIAQLKRAIERAPDLEPVIERMQERQQQRTQLQQEKASAQALRQLQLDQTRIEEDVRSAVANWRATLATEAVDGGRALLREVLSGPLVFTPTDTGYNFRGPVVLGDLIAGAVNQEVQAAGAQLVASPGGFESVGDGAHRLASPTGVATDVLRSRYRARLNRRGDSHICATLE